MSGSDPTKRIARTAKSARRASGARAGRDELRITNLGSYAEIFAAPAQDRITAIKNGVPARFVVTLTTSMGTSKDRVLRILSLSRATIDRKISRNATLTPDEGQKVMGIAKLVGLVETMVGQSGDPAGFDAAKWLAKWIGEESPALGGRKPSEFLDTAEGQELVSTLLQRMQSGAYS